MINIKSFIRNIESDLRNTFIENWEDPKFLRESNKKIWKLKDLRDHKV